jgi:hypothetical protein
MPDLQSELSKVINEWDAEPADTPAAPGGLRPFAISNNATRATFNMVRDNPGITRVAAVRRLMDAGYKQNSVSSLYVQMIRQGMIRDSGSGMYVTQAEYTPLKYGLRNPPKPPKAPKVAKAVKAPAEPKAAPVAKRKYVRRNAAAKAAAYEAHENYNPTAVSAEPKVVAPPEFNAEGFVNALTLKQAKAVYGELKKVFE